MDLIIHDVEYCEGTVNKWKAVWSSICEMCYNNNNIKEEIITVPGSIQIDQDVVLHSNEKEHCNIYRMKKCINIEDLTLDAVWKVYSGYAGPGHMPSVVPEFKRLHVPEYLFYEIGVDSWFRHSFPNCKVTFWET